MAVTGFLKQVKELKQQEIASLATRTDMGRLRRQAESAAPHGNLLKALGQSTPARVGIIAEIKKASPSKGPIRLDLDPFELSRQYTRGGARAISVLTESNFFKGSLADLETARRATHLPILRKDFIFSEFQIYEARAAGANSVLLITPLMAPGELADYIALSRELGMEPLVEINSERQFETAAKAGATLIGINNRNLETLETDLNVAQRLAPFFTHGLIPVAASGISARTDIEAGIEAGIVNFLVGESIVRAQDTEAFIGELLGGTGRKTASKSPLVKICGLTDPDEAVACRALGADAIGLVFHEKSPRHLSIDQARKITGALPRDTITVGVFVNRDPGYIMERVAACNLRAVQLHGQESPEQVKALAASGVWVIKTLFARQHPGFDMARAYENVWGFLVEDGRGALPGGNARPWEWNRAGRIDADARVRRILAGGLDPDNVQQAVNSIEPDMVDVSSGVERSFGRKDLKRVAKFIQAVKGTT